MADLTQTPANVRSGTGARIQTATAGEAIAAGDALYQSSDKWYKCDANDANKIAISGMAVVGASADGDSFVVQTGGKFNIGATTAKGLIYIVSATQGIAPHTDLASGWYPIIVGVADDTSGTLTLVLKNGGYTV
jgi:hypothetical protein